MNLLILLVAASLTSGVPLPPSAVAANLNAVRSHHDSSRVHDYTHCYAEAQESGRLVVVVSADWCGPCQRLKSTLDELGVKYAVVESDSELGRELLHGDAIPQLVVYDRVFTWRVRRLTGVRPKSELRDFLHTPVDRPRAQPSYRAAPFRRLFCRGCR